MSAQPFGKVLGVSAALAIILPLAYPSSAFAQGYGYSPPPAPNRVYSWTDSPDYYGPPGDEAYGDSGPGYYPQPYGGYDSAAGGDEGYGEPTYGGDYRGPYNGWRNPQSYGGGYDSAYGREAQPIFNYLTPPNRETTEGYGGSYAPSGPVAYGGGQFVVAIGGLNLRAAPNGAAPVRTSLPGGTPVTLAGPEVGGWWPVETPYGPGWVYGRYLAPA